MARTAKKTNQFHPSGATDRFTPAASALDTLKMLVRYKAWANGLTFGSVMELPDGEALRQWPTRFGNMAYTLNHVLCGGRYSQAPSVRKETQLHRTEHRPYAGAWRFVGRCAGDGPLVYRSHRRMVGRGSRESRSSRVCRRRRRDDDPRADRAACRQSCYLSPWFCRRYDVPSALHAAVKRSSCFYQGSFYWMLLT